jgi:hypothetical protein
VKFTAYAYGAWIGLALAVVLLASAWLRLTDDLVVGADSR